MEGKKQGVGNACGAGAQLSGMCNSGSVRHAER